MNKIINVFANGFNNHELLDYMAVSVAENLDDGYEPMGPMVLSTTSCGRFNDSIHYTYLQVMHKVEVVK